MYLLTTNRFDDNHLQEDRAVYSFFGTSEASISTARGLHALQHRGHEVTYIVSFDVKEFQAHRRIGHFDENFGPYSLVFFSIDELSRAMRNAGKNNDCPLFCDACFTDDYPIELEPGLFAKLVSNGIGRQVTSKKVSVA